MGRVAGGSPGSAGGDGRPARLRLLATAGLLLALGAEPFGLAGCAHTPDDGVVHRLQRGENLYRLSRYYEVSTQAILKANRIQDPHAIPAGTKLWIPGAQRWPPKGPLLAPDLEGEARSLAFAWPVRGRVTSGFGQRRSRAHDGIDVSAPPGTPIRAAEAGLVIYSGNGLGAYGQTVILRHAGPFDSVYAHNRRNHVRKGQRVAKGERIAEVGSTGNATGPHLHFEIRRLDRARDPLLYLP
jgi:murein DD-endopeptidase MepM/ murein hydrolase activator NlpD